MGNNVLLRLTQVVSGALFLLGFVIGNSGMKLEKAGQGLMEYQQWYYLYTIAQDLGIVAIIIGLFGAWSAWMIGIIANQEKIQTVASNIIPFEQSPQPIQAPPNDLRPAV